MRASTIQGVAFKGVRPTEAEMDALEATIDDQMYCGNDVLILIAEVRRIKTTARVAFKFLGSIAEEIDPDIRSPLKKGSPRVR